MNYKEFLTAAGVPPELHPEALASLKRAREQSKKVVPYKRWAPLVMAWVVPRLPWEAENLPERYAKWDNDVSINGDPWPWAQDSSGRWYRHCPLEDTPEVRAKCYWAKGHHPRSRWARYIWLGWRNRATKMSESLGVPATPDKIQMWGDPQTSKSHEGVKVYRMGDVWQIMSVTKFGPFAIRRNVGWKLNNVLENGHTIANITWIPFSFPLWKG